MCNICRISSWCVAHCSWNKPGEKPSVHPESLPNPNSTPQPQSQSLSPREGSSPWNALFFCWYPGLFNHSWVAAHSLNKTVSLDICTDFTKWQQPGTLGFPAVSIAPINVRTPLPFPALVLCASLSAPPPLLDAQTWTKPSVASFQLLFNIFPDFDSSGFPSKWY